MTTYNTGNPIGSTDARDLYDNAQNLDNFANGTAASYTDRLGVSRRSLAGIDSAADNVLNSIGYAVPVAYASGISLTLTSQTVDYNGVIYAPLSSALPFTTSSWGTDAAKFRAIQVTDADLITYTPAGTGAVASTVQSKLRETVSVKDFGAVGDGIADDTLAVQAADAHAASVRTRLVFPSGIYKLTSSTTFSSQVEMYDGAVITSASSIYIKFGRGFIAGLQGCLDTDAPVQFIGIETIYPQWFGNCGYTSQDSSAALNRAFRAARAGMNGINKTTDAGFGCVHVHLIRGNYRCNNVDVFCQTIVTGEVTGAINNSIICQIDRTQPAVRVHAKNYSLTNTVLNDSNGINTFSRVCFRSETANDTVENAPIVKFYSPAQSVPIFGIAGDGVGGNIGHTDTTFENCWFQFSAGACIATDEARLDFQLIDCTFDVVRSGVEYIGTSLGDLRATNVQFFECVRRALYVTTTSKVKTRFDSCLFNGCGNSFNSNAAYRRAINFTQGSTTSSELIVRNCRFLRVDDSGTQFGGAIAFQGKLFELSDSYFFDSDNSDLQKAMFLQADHIKVVDNIFVSNSLADYTNSRFISLSQSPQPSFVKINGNVFRNTNASSIARWIHSDYAIENTDVSENSFYGNVVSALDINIYDRSSKIFPNLGYGPKMRPGNSIPGNGTWVVGDVVWNTAITNAAGQPIGWVCVVAGTPGTWRAFGVTT